MSRKLRVEGLEVRKLLTADLGFAGPDVDEAIYASSNPHGGGDGGGDITDILFDVLPNTTERQDGGGGNDGIDIIIWDVVG